MLVGRSARPTIANKKLRSRVSLERIPLAKWTGRSLILGAFDWFRFRSTQFNERLSPANFVAPDLTVGWAFGKQTF